MGTVFVHETAFQLDSSPFWTALTQAAHHDSQSMVVITPSSEQKTDVYYHLKEVSGLLPRVLSLDELIFEAEGKNSQDSRALFLVLLDTILQKAYDRSPTEKTDGFLSCLLDLHYTLFHHNISLEEYVRSHPAHLRDRANRYADFLSDFRSALSKTFPLNRYSVYKTIQQKDFQSIRTFCSDKHVYFYGFLSVDPYQKPLLETLFSISTSASVLLPFHEDYSCFELTRSSRIWLSNLPDLSVHHVPSSEPQLPDALTVYESDTQETEAFSLASLVSEHHTSSTCSIAQLATHNFFSGAFREFDIPFSTTQSGQIHPFTSFALSLLNLIQTGLSSEKLITLFSSPYAQHWHTEDTSYPLSPLPIMTFSQRLTSPYFDDYVSQLEALEPALKELEIPVHISSFLEGLSSFFSALQLVLSSESPAQWQHHFKALLRGFVPDRSKFLDDTHFVIASFEDTLQTFVFSHASSFGYTSSSAFSGLVRHLFQDWHPDGLYDTTSSVHFTPLESLQWRGSHIPLVPQCTDSLLPQRSSDNPLFPESAQLKCRVSLSRQSANKQWFAFCQLVADGKTLFSYPKYTRKTPGFASHFFDLVSSEFGCSLDYKPLGRGDTRSKTEQQVMSPSLKYSRSSSSFDSPSGPLGSTLDKLSFSASQLDAYQICPYRYFLKYILKLQPYQTTQGDVAAHEWGAIVHAIFQDYNKLRQSKQTHQHSLDALIKIARAHFDAAKQDTLQWDVKEGLLFGTEERDGLLKAYIDIENDLEYQSDPLGVEHPFALTEPIALKGVIDAVFGLNGQHQAYVLDYKTGKGLPSSTDVRLYRSLQLSVYMLASKTLFPNYEIVGASIFQLNSEKHVGKSIVCSTEDAKKEIFKLGRKRPFIFDDTFYSGLNVHLKTLSSAIKKGLFDTTDYEHLQHMTARSSSCFTCDYKHQCQFKERYSR